MTDERAAEGVEHLQAAGRELLAAARVFLDVVEDLVEDRSRLADAAAVVSEVVRDGLGRRGAPFTAAWGDAADPTDATDGGPGGPDAPGGDAGPGAGAPAGAGTDPGGEDPSAGDAAPDPAGGAAPDPAGGATSPSRPTRVRRIPVD